MEIIITESDPKFFEALRDPQGFLPILAEAMRKIVENFAEVSSRYAPENEGNQPGRWSLRTKRPMGYWERGVGWWEPKGKAKEGVPTISLGKPKRTPEGVTSLSAMGIEGVGGYKLKNRSEQLGSRWTTEVEQGDEVVGTVRNTASYSSYVQGLYQARLHEARDWQTFEQSWQTDEVQQVVTDETMNAIDTYYNLRG